MHMAIASRLLATTALLALSACASAPATPANKWGIFISCKPAAGLLPTAAFHAMARAMCSDLRDRIGAHGVPTRMLYIEDPVANVHQVIPQAMARSATPLDGLVQLVVNSGSNGSRKETTADISYLPISLSAAPDDSNALAGTGPRRHYLLSTGEPDYAGIDIQRPVADFEQVLVKGNIIQKQTLAPWRATSPTAASRSPA